METGLKRFQPVGAMMSLQLQGVLRIRGCSYGNRLFGTVLHVRAHWIGYLVAAVLGAIARAIVRGGTRGWVRWLAFGGLAGAVALWFYVVTALSRLLVPFALAAFCSGALLYGLWSVRRKERLSVHFET